MTTPTYTPMTRADFAAVGIERLEKCACHKNHIEAGSRIHPAGCALCGDRKYVAIDITTGVLCNREPATTQQETEAAVEWLGSYKQPKFDDIIIRPHRTRILHIRPGEAIELNERWQCDGCDDWIDDPLVYDICPKCGGLLELRITGFHGLLITGGDTPLNPDHVAALIEQADAAGVPLWTFGATHLEREDGTTYLGATYRNLPASMMGGK